MTYDLFGYFVPTIHTLSGQNHLSINHLSTIYQTVFILLIGLSSQAQSLNLDHCLSLSDKSIDLTELLELVEAIDYPEEGLTLSYLEGLSFEKVNKKVELKENSKYLGRVKICNNSDYQHWTFRTQRELLSHFKVIYIQNDEVITKNSGDFEKRENQDGYFPIQSNSNFVDVRLNSEELRVFYFYFENQRRFASPKISLSIHPKDDDFFASLHAWKSRTYLVAGLFSFLIILGFTFFINSRDKAFLFYALYLLSLLIWIFYAAGLYDEFLQNKIFVEHPEDARSIGTVIICYVFYITFLWYFGDVFNYVKWGKKYYWIWITYILTFTPLIIITNFTTENNIQLFFTLGFIFNVGMTFLTIEAIRRLWKLRKEEQIKNVLIGLAIMLLLLVTASFEIVSSDFQIPEFSILSAFFIVEIVFFLWALSKRYKTYLVSETEKEIISQNLKEKDTLLREIHHRVKNNLQVISALLTLQSKYVKDDHAIVALREGQGRVQSMALIHQDLYQHDNLKGVNTKEYFEKLTDTLIETYDTEDRNIEVCCDIEPILLDVDTMIPLGLIVNELTSNALKHAFAETNGGIISVELKESNNNLVLKIMDNGSGADLELLESKSFGFSLIKSFARRLDADLIVNNEGGLEIIMHIKNYQKAA